MKGIYTWISELITMPNPVIVEIGANDGTDTIKLASIPGSRVYCFEPEPRCKLENMSENVTVNRCALSNKRGLMTFNQSDAIGHNWTYSGSLLKPKNHLTKHSHVYFKNKIRVPVETLDNYCTEVNITHIDFLYMDTQGAEFNIFEGAKEIIKKTKYIYTEYSNEEMYEGQKNLSEILKLLGTFEILEDWPIEPANVLIKNMAL
jgi:FkbM family methyltransferase